MKQPSGFGTPYSKQDKFYSPQTTSQANTLKQPEGVRKSKKVPKRQPLYK